MIQSMNLTVLPNAEKHRENWFLVWEIWDIFLSSFISEQLMQHWLDMFWNWAPTIFDSQDWNETKLENEVSPSGQWSIGLNITVECQTHLQLITLPKFKSSTSQDAGYLFGWAALTPCRNECWALSKWSRKKLGHKAPIQYIYASEAHQSAEQLSSHLTFLDYLTLKTQKTIRQLKVLELGINILSWTSMIWF